MVYTNRGFSTDGVGTQRPWSVVHAFEKLSVCNYVCTYGWMDGWVDGFVCVFRSGSTHLSGRAWLCTLRDEELS